MDPSKTGAIICEARKKLNMTQKDLADKLYVSDKAVSKWERGLCFPDISVLIPLTEVLGISLYDLLKGEKMNKKEVEETLKNTITYSNNEVKKKKKKYFYVSTAIISLVVIASIGIILSLTYFNEENRNIRYIVNHDEIYDISKYTDNKTSSSDLKYPEKIEGIFFDLSLGYPNLTMDDDSKNHNIELQYPATFNKITKDYNDEIYVRKGIINNATILFTVVEDLETFSVRFNDYRYTIKRDELLKVYNISDFKELQNKDNWEKIVSKKLEDNKFLHDTFSSVFKESKVSKDEITKKIIPDK